MKWFYITWVLKNMYQFEHMTTKTVYKNHGKTHDKVIFVYTRPEITMNDIN